MNSNLDSHMLSQSASGVLCTFLYRCFKDLLAYMELSPYLLGLTFCFSVLL